MNITIVRCPHCQAKLKLKQGFDAGQQFRCGQCLKAFSPTLAPAREKDEPVVEIDEPDDATDQEPALSQEARKPLDRKRLKERHATGPRKRLWIGLAILGVFLCGSIVFTATKLRSGGEEIVIARPTVEYSIPSVFRCRYPEGWKVQIQGEQVQWTVTFSSGSALFWIRSSRAVSTLEDVAVTGNMSFMRDPKSATLKVHEEEKALASAQFSDGYHEEGPVDFPTGVWPRSRFVTRGWFFSKPRRGYRMTMLAFPLQLQVVCVCQASDWPRLEPIFDEAVEAVEIGA